MGANGEGKSTFINIITGKLQPDAGKIEWAKRVRVGYLDQHAVLERGMTIRDVLKSAFQFLYDIEQQITDSYMKMGEVEGDELDALMNEVGDLQELLDTHDFYIIDSKVDEVAHHLGLDDIGLDRDVEDLSGGSAPKFC